MPALDDILSEKITLLHAKGQKRSLMESRREDGVFIKRGGKRLLSFSCNDYFGLSQHPHVIEAAIEASKKYGTGAGASRLVSGNHPLYGELEARLARAKGTEAALIFGSGYLANLGVIPALMGKNDLILADKVIHACMIDAAKLSDATTLRFAHNNMAHLRLLLEANRAEHQHCLILTETVFSMDGDRAPMAELKELAQEFDAWVMSDDAHGMFVTAQPERAGIQMGTLSKTLGSYGGYVCGSRTLVEYLQTAARSVIYSTGLPPAAIAAAIAAMELLENDAELCARPFANAIYFTQLLGIKEAESAIVPVILEESEKALAASEFLASHGYYVAAIRPPTVPENTARLRFAFSALHTREQIEKVAALLLENGFVCAPSR
ncbi:MAG: aminotransferase class I/II-fold pyridoxal phosphate-dependent enzyme [Alphaproteobacteria bacterium]|nr:aminotransferase class I/II-fold pyridoxal phosphate-dependent enzyme [Alphaproteobacteria bacterium]